MNGIKFTVTALTLCAIVLSAYIAARETTRYTVCGVVSKNKTILGISAGAYAEDNAIVIERVDGATVLYRNEDDWLIGKNNSSQIKNRLKEGETVEIICNGFGNVVEVSWVGERPKEKEPENTKTNAVPAEVLPQDQSK